MPDLYAQFKQSQSGAPSPSQKATTSTETKKNGGGLFGWLFGKKDEAATPTEPIAQTGPVDLFAQFQSERKQDTNEQKTVPEAQKPEQTASTTQTGKNDLYSQFQAEKSGQKVSPPLSDASVSETNNEKGDTPKSRGEMSLSNFLGSVASTGIEIADTISNLIKSTGKKMQESPLLKTAIENIPLVGQVIKGQNAIKEIKTDAEKKILEYINTPEGKDAVQLINEATSNLPLKAFSIVNSIGRGEFEKRYENYQNLLNEAKSDASVDPIKKLAFNIQNTAPQTVIGVLLALGTTAITKNPNVGRTIGGLYWSALSANEQIQERGKVESLGNIAVDVIGDEILGEYIGKILREPAEVIKGSIVAILKKQGKDFARTGVVEGGTEVAQTLIKYANDYRNAKTPEDRDAIVQQAKNYVTSGDILQEFGSAFISGGMIGAGAGIMQTQGSQQKTEQGTQPSESGTDLYQKFKTEEVNQPVEQINNNVDNTEKDPIEVELSIAGKVGPFYRSDTLDYGTLRTLHGKRFADAVESGGLVKVYRAGKEGETLKDGTFLTADPKMARSYTTQDTRGFGGPKVYKYEVNPKDLVSVDNLDFSELVYKKESGDQKISPVRDTTRDRVKNNIIQSPLVQEAKKYKSAEEFVNYYTSNIDKIPTTPEYQKYLQEKDAFVKRETEIYTEMKAMREKYLGKTIEDVPPEDIAKYEDLQKELNQTLSKKTLAPIPEGVITTHIGEKGLQSQLTDIWNKAQENPVVLERSSKEGESLAFTPKNLNKPSSPKAQAEIDAIVKRSDIVKELEQKLNVPIRRGKFRQRAAGIFKTKQNVIRFKQGYLSTIFHEVGHFIDYNVEQFSKKITEAEREALLIEYIDPPKVLRRRQGEAFSEFLRYYMTEPKRAFDISPKFHSYFESRIQEFPEVKETIEKAKSDYLRWEDMPSTAKVMSQISYDPAGTNKQKAIDTIVEKYHQLYENAMDDLHPIKEYVDMAKKQNGELPAKENPYVLARVLRGWVGKAETFLEKGTFDRAFWSINEKGVTIPKFTGKSFKEIVSPMQEKDGGLADLSTYLIARRSISLSQRGIKTGIDVVDARQAVKELESKHKEINGVAEDLYTYQDKVLAYGQQSGLYDSKFMEKIRALNPDYVPFYRVMEELQASGYMGKGIANVSKQIKKIRGSDRDIINPLESIVRNTFAIIDASERNAVAMAIVNMSKMSPELGKLFEPVPTPQTKVASVNAGDIIDQAMKQMTGVNFDTKLSETIPSELSNQIINIFRPSMINKDNIVSVLIDGKAQYFQVDPAIYRSMQGLGQEDVALVLRILSYPAKFLRAGATLSPDFMIRNPARDQLTAFVYSKYGFIPVVDLARGAYSLFKQDDAFWLWRMGGGEHAALVSLDREYLNKKTFEDVLASKGAKSLQYVKNPLKLLQALSEVGEAGTRLGEAKKALKRGADPISAAYASREVTLDFARIGSKTKAINMLVSFFNAGLQAQDKMIRAFKDRPYQTTLKTVMAITLPSILLYLVNRDDPRWKEIPQWQKDLFWIVMTDNHIYRIPKPFELGIIFGSLPERMLEYIDKKDSDVFDSIFTSIMNGATPGVLPTFLLPWIENATNYSLFLDRNLVSPSKENLPSEAQYNEYSHEFSKILGKWLSLSPIKIDNVLKGYFAGLGDYVSSGMDLILKGTGIANPIERPAKKLEDFSIIKSFMIKEPIGYNSESVSKFYDTSDRSTAGFQYYKKLMEDGKKEEAQAYFSDHPELKLSQYYTNVRDQLSQMADMKDRVLKSSTLTPEIKRDKIDKIDRLMTETAQKSLEMTIKQ